MIEVIINGEKRALTVEGDMPILWALRDLGLTGTKYGCGIAQCGACTIHIDGEAVRACSLPVSSLRSGQKITTIEGLAGKTLHPLQQAFIDLDVPQCGYCQSGQIMAAAALLAKNPHPDDGAIEAEMTNICRCGTYNRIRAAIKQAADQITKKA
jgi:isoquinoline 1-oxidoreductase subunit alpha